MTVPNLLHRIKRKKRPGKKGNREREIACRMAGCAMSLATYKCAFQDFHALLSTGKNSRKAGHEGKAYAFGKAERQPRPEAGLTGASPQPPKAGKPERQKKMRTWAKSGPRLHGPLVLPSVAAGLATPGGGLTPPWAPVAFGHPPEAVCLRVGDGARASQEPSGRGFLIAGEGRELKKEKRPHGQKNGLFPAKAFLRVCARQRRL